MNEALLDAVASRWARLGAMLNVPAAPSTPDLERLLLDTARVVSSNSRLFILAATWLAAYGDYVAKHRLARLIRDELEAEHLPVMGLLLDSARQHSGSGGSRFNLAIDACKTAADARPLFDVERRSAPLSRLAEQRASTLSRKWGRWMADFDLKRDALRPEEWVAEQNPALRVRALTGGDLVASVLAECEADPNVIESESELARCCGASRPAVKDAIRRLRLAGILRVVYRGRSKSVELRHREAA